MNRQELEAECDRLLEEREHFEYELGKAQVDFDNLKDLSDEYLKAIMDEIQAEQKKELPENRLTRFAKRTDKWKQHKEGLALARQKKVEAKIALTMNRKKYELAYAKYLKS